MTQESETEARGAWERGVLEKLVLEIVAERRRARRWNVFFKLLFFAYLVAVTLSLAWSWPPMMIPTEGDVAAKIKVKGMILPDSLSSADLLIQGLERAADSHVRGILLDMNSPGGSPVQAATVYEAIRRIKQENPDLPIIAVVGDMCASGCYYIAAAADEIYVSPYSIVGSIGVIMNGFGFVEAIRKLGIERRLLTAGEHKALMDPFSPVNLAEKEHVQGLLREVHHHFIAAVRTGRGSRLQDDPKIFSGLIWTGSQGITLGLADGIGDLRSVARKVLGVRKIIDFTPKEDMWQRLVRRLGTSVGAILGGALGGIEGLR